MSHFPFIDNDALKNNLDTTFRHIVELVAIADEYDKILSSSFRKTIIIYTASVIEALLLWRLKKKIKSTKVELSDKWKYYNIKILHQIDTSEEIIGGNRKKEKKDINKLDFVRVIDLCVKHGIITEQFSEKAHKVRELRNRLHIGGLAEIEKEYTKKDLNFVFGVAKKVKNTVSKEFRFRPLGSKYTKIGGL